MFIALTEIAVTLAWAGVKTFVSSAYWGSRYLMYGKELSAEEIYRKQLLDRLSDLEDEVHQLREEKTEAPIVETTYLEEVPTTTVDLREEKTKATYF